MAIKGVRKILAGLVGALAIAGAAHADAPVFTDEGWYQVEGTRAPGEQAGELSVVPRAEAPAPAPTQATPNAQASKAEGSQTPAQPSFPPLPCAGERGRLIRRVLELHGLSLSRVDITDDALGRLGANPGGLTMQWGLPFAVDPDLQLVAGNVPLPPGAANYDSETRQDFESYSQCQRPVR